MNRYLIYIMSLLLWAGMLTSCDEVEEVSIYDNWEARNQAFTDSIHALAADRLVPLGSSETTGKVKVEDIADNVVFALETTASTNEAKQYVYCKKVKRAGVSLGDPPVLTDAVSVFYYGTNILGERFDGNFKGFSATDKGTLDAAQKAPTAFDSPAEFKVSEVIAGWTVALQYMHEGERWMLYIPHQSAYGTSDNGNILGYSALTFDLQLEQVK